MLPVEVGYSWPEIEPRELDALEKAVLCYRQPIESSEGLGKWYFDEVTPEIVLRLIAEIRELRKDLGMERLIRESSQDTAKRLGDAIDAHEEEDHLTESCRFPWNKHKVWVRHS